MLSAGPTPVAPHFVLDGSPGPGYTLIGGTGISALPLLPQCLSQQWDAHMTTSPGALGFPLQRQGDSAAPHVLPTQLSTIGEPGLQPLSVALQPLPVTFQPLSVTFQPLSVTFQPLSVTFQPLSVTFQPLSVTFQPLSVTFQPLSVALQPLSVTFQPLSVALQPLSVTFQPLSVTFQPLSVTFQPLSVTFQPLSVTFQPLSVTFQPLSVTFQPLSVALQPLSVTFQPCRLPFNHCRLPFNHCRLLFNRCRLLFNHCWLLLRLPSGTAQPGASRFLLLLLSTALGSLHPLHRAGPMSSKLQKVRRTATRPPESPDGYYDLEDGADAWLGARATVLGPINVDPLPGSLAYRLLHERTEFDPPTPEQAILNRRREEARRVQVWGGGMGYSGGG